MTDRTIDTLQRHGPGWPRPRCPFAGSGVDAAAQPRRLPDCRGFRAEAVDLTAISRQLPFVGEGLPPRAFTCGHLGPAAGHRGFYPACHHPEGLPTRWNATMAVGCR